MDYIACQAPLSMGFFRQEHWSALPSPSPEDLHDPGIKPVSPALEGGLFITEPPGKPKCILIRFLSGDTEGLRCYLLLCPGVGAS